MASLAPLYHFPNGIIEYGQRIEFPPSRTPNASQFIAWADIINLSDPAFLLLGPFNFIKPSAAPDLSRTPTYRQFISADLWTQLKLLCAPRGIIPPALLATTKAPRASNRRKHLRQA